jgi:Flp pilus assembly pilin Flp
MRNLTLKAYTWAQAHKGNEEGQTALEYALVTAFVSLALILLLVGIGTGAVTGAVAKVNGFTGT